MITVWSVPNPNQSAGIFRLVQGVEQEPVPGHRELLPVLWEMGISPDVHVLPGSPQVPGGPMEARLPQTHEEALQLALVGRSLRPKDEADTRSVIERRFQELFAQSPEGFRPLWRQDARELLITWGTGREQ